MQAFDARPSFISDLPSPQLALPIDEPPEKTDSPPSSESGQAVEHQTIIDTVESISLPAALQPAPAVEAEDKLDFNVQGAPLMQPAEPDLHDDAHYIEPLTQAEQISVEEDLAEPFVKPRTWPWAVGAIIAVLLLIAQSAYFLRVDLAARIPAVKPALLTYCKLLGCSVPYPEKSALISIESSSLDADPTHENQITLNALLRNHAGFNQAFPSLSLTLNDNQDKPLARRLFTPAEYLPAEESEKTGFRGNHEINIKLPLYTGTLRPVGYQLEFFYGLKAVPPAKTHT